MRLVDGLSKLDGVERLFDGPCFHEAALQLDRPVAPVLEALAERNILGGLDLLAYSPQLDNALLVCATETKTDEDIDAYIAAMHDVLDKQSLRSA